MAEGDEQPGVDLETMLSEDGKDGMLGLQMESIRRGADEYTEEGGMGNILSYNQDEQLQDFTDDVNEALAELTDAGYPIVDMSINTLRRGCTFDYEAHILYREGDVDGF